MISGIVKEIKDKVDISNRTYEKEQIKIIIAEIYNEKKGYTKQEIVDALKARIAVFKQQFEASKGSIEKMSVNNSRRC